MRAVVQPGYGAPELLEIAEVERPVPGAGDVLVAMRASTVSAGDVHLLSGKPYLVRAAFGLRRPRNPVPGMAVSGRVEAVGANVTHFVIGNEVHGEATGGALAEYVVVAEDRLARKPKGLSFGQAAALPWAITALQALRDTGRIQPGKRVLVNGASGAVGTFAVQIGKALGGRVTGVSSTRNLELVRSLGAEEVVDYTTSDFVASGQRYDVIIDLVGNRSLAELRRVLEPDGTYVACGGKFGDWIGPITWMASVGIGSALGKPKLRTFLAKPNRADLEVLNELVESGAVTPVIDRRYDLADVRDAYRYKAMGRSAGNVVIDIAD